MDRALLGFSHVVLPAVYRCLIATCIVLQNAGVRTQVQRKSGNPFQ